MELFSSNIKKFQVTEAPKKFLTFSQKKPFLIFRETETPKNSLYFRKRNILIFQETELSYISGNRNFKKALIFQETELSELEK